MRISNIALHRKNFQLDCLTITKGQTATLSPQKDCRRNRK